MGRLILGIVSGFVAFFIFSTVSGFVITAAWPDYAAVRESMDFTLAMLLTRLAMGATGLIIAGWVAGLVVRDRVMKTCTPLGIILLIVFIPVHIQLFDVFPLWYHAWFLLTIIPFCLLGGKLNNTIHE